MEGFLKAGLMQKHVNYQAEDKYRYVNGTLYQLTLPGDVPDALLDTNGQIERLTLISRQFHDPETAFAFIKANGNLWEQVRKRLNKTKEGAE